MYNLGTTTITKGTSNRATNETDLRIITEAGIRTDIQIIIKAFTMEEIMTITGIIIIIGM